jgi:hypothetical protein
MAAAFAPTAPSSTSSPLAGPGATHDRPIPNPIRPNTTIRFILTPKHEAISSSSWSGFNGEQWGGDMENMHP